MDGSSLRQHHCPAWHADLILIDGDLSLSRFAVFACGLRESRIGGSYRFSQTAECAALAEERSELDVPESSGW